MFDENKTNEDPNKSAKGGKTRTRLREVDFMRVEDTTHGQELASFELEVKEKIASVQSPLEELISRETEDNENQSKRISHYKLTCLIRKAGLTPLQRKCYRLIWIHGLSESKAARELNVSRSRVRNLKRIIRSLLARTCRQEKERKLRASDVLSSCRTKGERQICRIHLEEGKTISEIARDLGLSRQAVEKVLKRILKRG